MFLCIALLSLRVLADDYLPCHPKISTLEYYQTHGDCSLCAHNCKYSQRKKGGDRGLQSERKMELDKKINKKMLWGPGAVNVLI